MEVSFVGMSGVSEVTASVLEHDVRTVAECRKGYTAFQRGDVLVAKITPCFENGKIVMADIPHAFGFGSTEFHVIRPRPDKLDPRFLLHFLRVPFFRIQGERRMTGSAGQRRVPANFLSTFDIPLPPLLLQRRIAEVLDKAEALRAKRRAALAQLDSLTKSLFLDLFGDPATNPKGWPTKPLGEIGKVITGNTPPRSNPNYYGKHIEWIKSDNINTPHYYLTKATEGLSESGKSIARTVPAGSILITCIAGSPECIGNASMTDREVAFNQQINAFIPDKEDAHFIYAQMIVGKRLIQEASTAGMKGMVSKGRFEQILFPLPPISLQREFARRVAAVEKLKTAQRAALTELDALFASLQHRAFRGEL
jgi:type I restriction enzyme S subunit